jgi:methyl-accepting chemotaxis protein
MNKQKKLSLQFKILSIFMIIITTFSLLNVASVIKIKSIASQLNSESDVEKAQKFVTLLSKAQENIQFLVLNSSSGDGMDSEKSIKILTQVDALWKNLSADSFLKSHDSLLGSFTKYQAKYVETIKLLKDDSALEAAENVLGSIPKTYSVVQTELSTIIASGLASIEDTNTQTNESIKEFNLFLVIASVILIFGFGLMITYLVKLIVKPLGNIQKTLNNVSINVNENSRNLEQNANNLSDGSNKLSTNLDSTTSTLTELLAMLGKTIEEIDVATKNSEELQGSANQGITAVENMSVSVNEINTNNQLMTNVVAEVAASLNSIINVIGEITAKTDVINDIVFQTKLLSFNASVEAARAGEYGKGFSVVAEEVGKLALESGTAAKEITELLNQSTQTVENIVKSSTKKMGEVTSVSDKKVKEGLLRTEECRTALDDIIVRVDQMKEIVKEIHVASNEQSQGVSTVNNGMDVLDGVIRSTNDISNSTLTFSNSLGVESEKLQETYEELNIIINGGNSSVKTITEENPSEEIENVEFVDFDSKKNELEKLSS